MDKIVGIDEYAISDYKSDIIKKYTLNVYV